VQIAAWCIGEFGEQLIYNANDDDEPIEVTEIEVIDLLDSILMTSFTTQVSKEYVITALLKLTTRFKSGLSRIRHILDFYGSSMDIELQQRSVEYSALMDNDQLRAPLLERMPVKELEEEAYSDDDQGTKRVERKRSLSPPSSRRSPVPSLQTSQASNLLDLLDGTPPRPASSVSSGSGNIKDLLGDFSRETPQPAPVGNSDGILSLFDSPSSSLSTGNAPIVAYDKNNVYVEITLEPKTSPNITTINLKATNRNSFPVTGFSFQAAVPKMLKLQVLPASSTEIPPKNSGSVVQTMRIANPQQHPLRMLTRVAYTLNGQTVNDEGQLNNF